MTKRAYQVGPRKDGAWEVKRADSDRASRVFEHKREAVKAARAMASRQGLGIVVLTKGGKIEREVPHQKLSIHPSQPKEEKLTPEIEARLERFQRGEYKSRPLKDALKDLGLDE